MKGSEFSVWAFSADDRHTPIIRDVDYETAVKTAKYTIDLRNSMSGGIERIIITNGGDFTCFEWIAGKGITFPPGETTDD